MRISKYPVQSRHRVSSCSSRYAVPLATLTVLFILAGLNAFAQQLRVAAAADLQFAMKDLAASYEAKEKQHMTITYGSSGNFYTQLENGAPFDMFFSADITYPQKLIAAGLADRLSLYSYAFGRLALWVPPGSGLKLAATGFSSLLDPQVRKIAIANPEHAPYGSAAIAALQKAGLYEQVKAKLVFGENVSQAAQFVQSGNAQVGIVALSLAVSPAMEKGERWTIPADLHPPLEQAAVVIASSRNKAAANAFLEFAKSPEGKAILAKYGFTSVQSRQNEQLP
jgi:molybdate transport system substrate-binding protein